MFSSRTLPVYRDIQVSLLVLMHFFLKSLNIIYLPFKWFISKTRKYFFFSLFGRGVLSSLSSKGKGYLWMEIREVVRLLTILLVVGYLNEPLSVNADPASDSSSHSFQDVLPSSCTCNTNCSTSVKVVHKQRRERKPTYNFHPSNFKNKVSHNT